MKTEWHDRMIKVLQLNGKRERTQQAYARALRMLIDFYDKPPGLISEEEWHQSRLTHIPFEPTHIATSPTCGSTLTRCFRVCVGIFH
jgi:hypothetical protein